jgi:nickel/cobalt exporter
MEDKEKLPIVIKHWIEHNESHIEEYRQWAEKAGEMGLDGIKAWITEAIKAMEQSDSILKEALKDLEYR